MRNASKIGLQLMILVMFSLLFAGLQLQAQAASVTPIEGPKFSVSSSLQDNLKLFTGKDVYVHLRSGKTLQGYVKAIGNNFLHLEKLAGRDFYDALIRMEDISAIEAKFREIK